MKSKMRFDYRTVPQVGINRSDFDLSHGHTDTFKVDGLYPFFREEVYPGDSWKISTRAAVKALSPLKTPMMDNLHLDMFFFFVPFRILWEHWKEFNGDVEYSDSTDYTIPQIETSGAGWSKGGFGEKLGIRIGKELTMSALYHRAYRKIWNDWFRHEWLQLKVIESYDDGPDPYTDDEILIVNKYYDYFTSCLPAPQKGDPILMDLGEEAPVVGNKMALGLEDYHTINPYTFGMVGDNATGGMLLKDGGYGQSLPYVDATSAVINSNNVLGLTEDADWSGAVADLSMATGFSINDLRTFIALNEMQELDARYGSRYNEMIKAHFKVDVPDYRVQRPEYIGGSHQMVKISTVVQTSQSDTTDQGTLTGLIADGVKSYASYSATEHGCILGLYAMRADLSYSQGLPRMFQTQLREEFYLPVFAHLSEQPVWNGEIYFNAESADLEAWGYNEAWSHLKQRESRVCGEFRPEFSPSLKQWHLSEEFTSRPDLDSDFMESAVPISQVLAIDLTTYDQFAIQAHHTVSAIRPMPTYARPKIGSGRF